MSNITNYGLTRSRTGCLWVSKYQQWHQTYNNDKIETRLIKVIIHCIPTLVLHKLELITY